MNASTATVSQKGRWWRRLRRSLIWVCVFVIVATTLLFAIFILPVIPDPTPSFMTRKGELREFNKTKEWQANKSHYSELTLISTTGLRVELTVRIPIETTSPRPLILLLGGYRTGRRAAQLFSETRDAVLS